MLDISQPQMHNVLKGQRRLQSELADALLRKLGLTVLDLFNNSEIYAHKHVLNADSYCPKQPIEVARLLESIAPEMIRPAGRKPPASDQRPFPVRRRAG
ncbi:MAG TPA: hypothetical protein VH325_07950 [Bryobacteraceae bacterium]|jgi:hypothetical protein|nr:hypothetical protein [Bryobacteraceae bacterium]